MSTLVECGVLENRNGKKGQQLVAPSIKG